MSNHPRRQRVRTPSWVDEDTIIDTALRTARGDGCVCDDPEMTVVDTPFGPAAHVGHDSPACPAFMAPVRWAAVPERP